MKVLIVDDNSANYLLMAQLLISEGIQVESKYSGSNIVSYLEEHPSIDLILMDIHMPVVDGPSALKRLRNSANQRSIRVIAVTADAGPEQLLRARQLGFDGFIAKPIDAARFGEQIRAIMNGVPVWDSGK